MFIHSDGEEISQQPHSPLPVEFTSTPGTGASLAKRRKMCEEVLPELLSPSLTECITGAQASKKKVKAGNDIEELIVQNLHVLNRRKEQVDEDKLFLKVDHCHTMLIFLPAKGPRQTANTKFALGY